MGFGECVSLNIPKDGPCTQSQIGVQFCSEDCTQILLCTQVGADPIRITNCDLQNDGYCAMDPNNVPKCSTETPECGVPPNEVVLCGRFGELPHPTRCDTTIFCNEDLVITETCTCTKGSFIDITRNSLPCIENTQCPRESVHCNNIGEIGTFPGSSDYCYTCWYDLTAGHEAIQVYTCESKLKLKSLLFPLSKAKQCQPVKGE